MVKSGKSSEEESAEALSFDELFDSFSKVGDRNSEDIALRNIDKWFRQADLFDRGLDTTDTVLTFPKIARGRKKITKDEFREMLEEIAQNKEMDVEGILEKLEGAGPPSYAGTTRPIRGSIAADNMERLTDSSLYTGIHKERFDEEGRGLGLAGRYDVVDPEKNEERHKQDDTHESEEDLETDEAEKRKESSSSGKDDVSDTDEAAGGYRRKDTSESQDDLESGDITSEEKESKRIIWRVLFGKDEVAQEYKHKDTKDTSESQDDLESEEDLKSDKKESKKIIGRGPSGKDEVALGYEQEDARETCFVEDLESDEKEKLKRKIDLEAKEQERKRSIKGGQSGKDEVSDMNGSDENKKNKRMSKKCCTLI